ncbi:MAG: prepilin-type N-terminal cleavage/methylation domain-containing protein [bacterium]|nr:prepilin-type N-terminal cleavage/methylation domain-containing protein [bacterium]
MKTFYNKKIRGFTLIETLVAIGILMMAVVGPISVAYKSLKSSMVAKDQFTASYLAQDAIEYMKALAIKTGGLPVCGTSNNGIDTCDVDTTRSIGDVYLINCNIRSCNLDFDINDGYFYASAGGTVSPFTREIRTKEISLKEMSVEVTVSFLSGKSTTSNYVTIYSNIFIP